MIIQRYILKGIYTYLLVITTIFLTIFIVYQSIDYLHEAAEGQLSINVLVKIIALKVPTSLLVEILPISFYLSIILFFRQLYLNNEMNCLSSFGFSKRKIFWLVIMMAIPLIVLSIYLQLFLRPIVTSSFLHITETAYNEVSLRKILPRELTYIKGKGLIYAEESSTDHNLLNVFFIKEQAENPWAVDVLVTKLIQEKKLPNGYKFWVGYGGSSYEGNIGKQSWNMTHFEKMLFKISDPIVNLSQSPGCIPTTTLLSNFKSRYCAAELHWRIAMPISIFVLAILAFGYSEIVKGKDKGINFLFAIIIYVLYFDLISLGLSLMKDGYISTYFGLWWLHGFLFLIGIGLLFYNKIFAPR